MEKKMKTTRTPLKFALLPLVWLVAALWLGCSGSSSSVLSSDTSGTDTATGTQDLSTGTPDLSTTGTPSTPVNLGSASTFVILAKSGIDSVPNSVITGNLGVSPIDSTGITGFSLTVDGGNTFATSTQVNGKLYAPDYTPPTPANLTAAVGAMEAAYNDAAGRTTPDFTELAGGLIGGLTLGRGLYKWGSGVLIASDVTLNGSATDVWIFQISGTLTQASATRVLLTGGALAKNVFWQVSDTVVLGTTAHLEGIVLGQVDITLSTGASVNGRLFAQTSVTLDQSTVTQPTQ